MILGLFFLHILKKPLFFIYLVIVDPVLPLLIMIFYFFLLSLHFSNLILFIFVFVSLCSKNKQILDGLSQKYLKVKSLKAQNILSTFLKFKKILFFLFIHFLFQGFKAFHKNTSHRIVRFIKSLEIKLIYM